VRLSHVTALPLVPCSGAPFAWTESNTAQATISVNGHYETVSNTVTTRHFNPGGADGAKGRDGRLGRSGAQGAAAAVGSFNIRIVESSLPGSRLLSMAPDRYNVAVVQFDKIGSPDGVLEPNEEFLLRGVSLLNNGAMGTPVRHPVIVTVMSSEWIEPSSEPVTLADEIPPGHTITLDHLPPLRFRLRHAFPLVPNVIPAAMVRFAFDVFVSRVNKRFQAPTNAEGRMLEVRR
jgi:hypothetical protein